MTTRLEKPNPETRNGAEYNVRRHPRRKGLWVVEILHHKFSKRIIAAGYDSMPFTSKKSAQIWADEDSNLECSPGEPRGYRVVLGGGAERGQ